MGQLGTTILGNPHMGKSTDFKFYLYTSTVVGLLLHLSRLPSRKKSEFARKNSFLMLAYYTIERHINKKPNNGEWVVNRQSHFVLPTGSGNRFSIAF